MEQQKTIATITYHRSDNFGSVLQCYALGEKLRQMGYDQYVIDYRRKEVAEKYQVLRKPTNRYLLLTDCYHLLHYGALKKRRERFESFRQNYLRLSRAYCEKNDLMKSPPKADAYIVGSDQVWNTDISDFDESYLLAFVKQGCKIAYAASGVAALPEEKKAYLKNAITTFDAVSLRENMAAAALEKDKVVIDPVLLLTKRDWEKVCIDTGRQKKYMLCYFAGGVSADFEAFTKKKAKELGLERVVLMPEWRNIFRAGSYAYDAGPREFVSLIRDAALVCTNSFHGTAFSVLLNKPFLVGQHVPFSDDRIATILGHLGMEAREIDPANPMLPENLLDFDFTCANEALETLRNDSVRWLNRAIEGE